MPVTQVPDYVPVDVATRLAALEAAQPMRDWMAHATAVVSSNNIRNLTSALEIAWTGRFIVMGAGRDSAICPDGYFDIIQPPNGTVIPRVGAASGTTVTAAATGIPLGAWDALYYIVPFGSVSTSQPGNFRIVNYTANFTVPYNWLFVAVRVGEVGTIFDPVRWFDGYTTTMWLSPTMGSGWVAYGSEYGTGQYRKVNGIVYLRGLVMNGTAGVIWSMPVGFRPMSQTGTDGTHLMIGGANLGVWRVDARVNGDIMANGFQGAGNNVWCSFSGMSYPAGA